MVDTVTQLGFTRNPSDRAVVNTQPPRPNTVDLAQASNPVAGETLGFTDGLVSTREQLMSQAQQNLSRSTTNTKNLEQYQANNPTPQSLSMGSRVEGEAPSAILGDLLSYQRDNRSILSESASREASALQALSNLINQAREDREQLEDLKDRQIERQQAILDYNTDLAEATGGAVFVDEEGNITISKDALPKETAEKMKAEDDLRDEFLGQNGIKDFINVQTQYKKIQNASDTAPGDLSLIFAYMKMLDPSSVVREGEFANAENTAGVPEQIRVQYNKALTGERLSQPQREGFKKEAGKIFNSHVETASQRQEFYKEMAIDRGLDPDDVVGVLGELEPIIIENIESTENPIEKEQKRNFLQKFIDKALGREPKPPLSSFDAGE